MGGILRARSDDPLTTSQLADEGDDGGDGCGRRRHSTVRTLVAFFEPAERAEQLSEFDALRG